MKPVIGGNLARVYRSDGFYIDVQGRGNAV